MLRQRQNISIKYFAQFLSEIGAIIRNIRKYVHQIIDISAPVSKTALVKESMTDIIASTSKTFGDLKSIQSLIAGYVKAHRIKIEKRSLSESHSTHFQSQQNSKRSSFAKEWLKNSIFQKEFASRSRPIAKTKSNLLGKLFEKEEKKYHIFEEEEKTVITNTQNMQVDNRQIKTRHQDSWVNRAQLLLSKFIQTNRQNLERIINKNRQCRNEVLCLKAQLMQNC